jgi:hypothetical protein
VISSVGQSPTELLVLGRRHGGREATERSEARPLATDRGSGVRLRGPTEEITPATRTPRPT